MEWTDMMHCQQQLQKIMRSLLPVRKSLLTASECELLAHLYLCPEQNTPILLSQNSGMKKEYEVVAEISNACAGSGRPQVYMEEVEQEFKKRMKG